MMKQLVCLGLFTTLLGCSGAQMVQQDQQTAKSQQTAASEKDANSTNLTGGSTSQECDPGKAPRGPLEPVDKTQMLADLLSKADSDKSGSLSLSEFQEFVLAPIKARLSAEELKTVSDKLAAKFAAEAGDDQVLSSEELKGAFEKRALLMPFNHAPQHGRGEPRQGRPTAEEMLAKFDTDKDGKLSLEELKAAHPKECHAGGRAEGHRPPSRRS